MKNLLFNDRLHLVRIAKGMNKSEMAGMLHISNAYLTRLENGERPVPQHVIDILNLDSPVTLRWYSNLMSILKPFKKNYMTEEEIDEIKRTLKKILGVS